MSYDLNQTQLNTFLNGLVSNQTHSLINAALLDSGYYPTRGLQLPTATGNDGAISGLPDTVNLNLGGTDSVGLYVETGSKVTVNIVKASPFGSVIAAGDGNKVTLDDKAGGDTLVGGGGHDTLIGGAGSYLIAGSGPTVLKDTIGDDTLMGGTGDDTINSSGNDDSIYGGSGPDTINMSGSGSALYAGTGYESISMSGSFDTIYLGQGSGPPATDVVKVTGSSDSIYAGTAGGVDSINAGSDTVNVYLSAAKSATQRVETDPTNHVWQISYGSGGATTNITVEGSDVVLHFTSGSNQTV
jgi:Ca2+-binding RTX toxin-like protein